MFELMRLLIIKANNEQTFLVKKLTSFVSFTIYFDSFFINGFFMSRVVMFDSIVLIVFYDLTFLKVLEVSFLAGNYFWVTMELSFLLKVGGW